jgi:hypothetical protein
VLDEEVDPRKARIVKRASARTESSATRTWSIPDEHAKKGRGHVRSFRAACLVRLRGMRSEIALAAIVTLIEADMILVRRPESG